MPSFLLNGAGGYIVTETGDRIIIAADELFDEIEVFDARSGWQVWSGTARWGVDDGRSRWRAGAAPSRWEVD